MKLPHPDGLLVAKACRLPRCCLFCEEPLATQRLGRKRVICREPGCRSAYHKAYGRDRRRGVNCAATRKARFDEQLRWCAGATA